MIVEKHKPITLKVITNFDGSLPIAAKTVSTTISIDIPQELIDIVEKMGKVQTTHINVFIPSFNITSKELE